MSKVDSTKPSYDALNSVSSSVRAFVELVDLIPEEDEGASLLRILSDRLESDFSKLQSEVYALWRLVPDTEKPD
jgi:hypothetical protein